ncbi:hypothetical protein A2313_03020 [Candidatus Roizmanbacteria bacterium RIFOXYB2_FULL_41_10]|uniref:Uncharacterized protein n=1 Tax=Candidatus Roizmanbacteria bacterium RIFOXYA1_FULL_41_12 TaxID=1802082 RepID=A0A1F7KEC2_9BACT|nr:MAG: hypothetical protein US97_C0013G0001 [Microgenomates group bacterium GW2011_GWF1_38_5]OGK66211.1 MAG: hypothetical protein A2209_00470 [Candidatus Roizmanbacteria bacterium RIFOXYA1_FULL_41_12]OGK69372.1 MAG: hypothetical protein A2313_03020 [Candidatus Roizmanbacteria bacterium RIFOXYB2_FULL_41_10]
MIYIQDLWEENQEIGLEEIRKTRRIATNLLLDAQEFDLTGQEVSNLENVLNNLRLLIEPSIHQLSLPGITL